MPPPISIVDKLIGGGNKVKTKIADTSVVASSPIKEAPAIEPDFSFDADAPSEATNLNALLDIEPNFSFDEPIKPVLIDTPIAIIPTLAVKRKIVPVVAEIVNSLPELNSKDGPSPIKKSRVIKPVLISDTVKE